LEVNDTELVCKALLVANTDPRISIVESLLVKYGLSNRWLASKLETSHTNVNAWLDPNGNTPRDRTIYEKMLDKIRQFGPIEANVEMQRGGARYIPVYMAGISAGPPSAGDASVDWIEVLDWGGDFERWGRPVSGSSMSELLQPGDIAVFENSKYENGDVVHVFKDGEDMVKCVRGEGVDAMLYSFNEDYAPVSASGWTVKGRCVQRIRYGKFRTKSVTDFPNGLHWSMRNENL
jgi:hypothetical protein